MTYCFQSAPVPTDFPVVSTDYTTFAVIYDCNVFKGMKYESTWILARDRKPNISTVEKAEKILKSKNVDVSKLDVTDQINC
ncbi:Apolipoprotein D-like protein [Leptotrombidium deliense]|uniref:Apolipoprotein D n=1 Tax=Leptotrombidium deliense TaxID=299467 RepID=A0A443SMV1_9ACAR|nr:Apolipoprotein D-like protein [Leptotrombidium deliense]